MFSGKTEELIRRIRLVLDGPPSLTKDTRVTDSPDKGLAVDV
jgi:thymidine kinase